MLMTKCLRGPDRRRPKAAGRAKGQICTSSDGHELPPVTFPQSDGRQFSAVTFQNRLTATDSRPSLHKPESRPSLVAVTPVQNDGHDYQSTTRAIAAVRRHGI